ncbi:MAG TPA: hypothetical protein GXZ46_07730 [Actinomycetales bacterium]|nr:hypothetical protein [Actinomycetales bacterium]
MNAKKNGKRGAQSPVEKWRDLSLVGKVSLVSAVLAELSAKVGMYRDLAQRPADKVRGPKWAWVLASFINGFGPAAYFAVGRKK